MVLYRKRDPPDLEIWWIWGGQDERWVRILNFGVNGEGKVGISNPAYIDKLSEKCEEATCLVMRFSIRSASPCKDKPFIKLADLRRSVDRSSI